MIKIRSTAYCNMAGGGFSGLTSQTSRPLSCGSDTPEYSGPPNHTQVTG
jgi:hypothetical protein